MGHPRTRRKALLVANTSWYVFNFRRPLARALRAEGFEVIFVAPKDEYSARLTDDGFEFRSLPMDRSGTNPIAELATLVWLVTLYQRERPDVVHHMTIKCVLYGSMAAHIARVPAIINAVTGLGHVFVSDTLRAALIRPFVRQMYRSAFGSDRLRVIFQNEDDVAAFQQLGLGTGARSTLIRGSGVDTARFSPRESSTSESPLTVLLVGRLIVEKGIVDFVEAAGLLQRKGVAARFVVAGSRDPGNPSSISPGRLARWRSEGIVEFVGHVDSIEDLVSQAAIVVLPSYREGLPRTLLEAAGMAKPIVATDVPGCRAVVAHEKNGLLVPVRDSAALAAAIERLLREPETRVRMGRAGRERVLQDFDVRKVVAETLEVYSSLLDLPTRS